MNIFGKGEFTWWQMGLFKISVLALGVAIGAYWSEIFLPYLTALFTVVIVFGVYIAYVWFRQ